ncbi:sugar ABC transporter substrate-binding protein [[Pantoea] beijingensis]|uniref:Sugar ABC transporter substrate-binding protein n=1 Tax=[Pantoea] beijingensis TaxID=1324864 RepID=A0A443IEI8_9GAMM|nr:MULTISPECIES: BMP family protein [Erwiniaceae]RWR02479.1 sugar ABC transporter substrate-binding protein [[Pantoea] beijingensis]
MAGLSRRDFAKMLAGAVLLPTLTPLLSSKAQAADAHVKVALLLPGSIADGGWNTLAWQGLQSLKKQGYTVAYSESVPQAQMEQAIRGYADDGFALIIGHSFEYGSAFAEIAPEYPDTQFFASTFKPAEAAPPNVEYVDLAYIQAAYAAGALAALISTNGRAVGFVGGGDNPTQQGMMRAFIAGAEKARSGVKGLGVITGEYGNAAKGREAATTMIGNGADVIWHAADVTGLGALQGAAAAKVKAIGCYSDQKDIVPGTVACSFKQNLDWLVEEVGHSVANHQFSGGKEWQPSVAKSWSVIYGSGQFDSKLVSASAWQAFLAIWQQLDSGALLVKV